MLAEVKIEQFRSYRKASLQLGPLTVLIGANAAGKSNALEAVRLLSWIASGNRLSAIRHALQDTDQTIRGRISDLGFRQGRSFSLACETTDVNWGSYSVRLDVREGDELHISDERVTGGYSSWTPLFEVITHQGGFPSAEVPPEAWADHDLLRTVVSDFSLEWTPGSKVSYHGLSAHWVAAVVIEAVTGRDYRDHIRESLLAPLGLDDEIFVGVGADSDARCADLHAIEDGEMRRSERANSREFRAAGVPGGGGYGTATGMAALYQMMLASGVLNGKRALGPRVIEFATRNHTGDRVDENMEMPMHRGLGPHVRGYTPTIRGLGAIASPTTFGHGGAGTSYSWGDPESGVSFTYLTNCMAPEPWHSIRLDQVSNIVHGSIVG